MGETRLCDNQSAILPRQKVVPDVYVVGKLIIVTFATLLLTAADILSCSFIHLFIAPERPIFKGTDLVADDLGAVVHALPQSAVTWYLAFFSRITGSR